MASGSFTSNTGSNLEIGAEWSATPDTAGNFSTVKVNVFLTHYSIYCAALLGSYIKIGNTVYNFSKGISQSEDSFTKTYIASYETTVSHLADGTKSLTIAVGWNFSGTYNGTAIGMLEASKTVTLDSIPRASSVTVPSSVKAGENITVSISSPLSSNRHKLTFSVGGREYTTGYLTGTSPTVEVPAILAYGITSALSASGLITLHTYNSAGTWIGKSEKTVTYKIPNTSDFIPSFGFSTVPVSNYPLISEKGIYAAGITRVKVNVTDVEGKYGATVSSCIISFGGTKTSGYTATSGSLSSGDITVSAKVTDSRGLTVTKSKVLKVLPYCSPFVTEASVFRCNETGEPDDSGAYMYVSAKAVSSELSNLNTAALYLSYKLHSSDSYSGKLDLVSGASLIVPAGLSAASSYDVKITCLDTVGCSTDFIVLIPTALVDMHMKDGSVRFGGYCEKKGFECNWDANFAAKLSIGEAPVEDFVVGFGESGIWKWRKWNSGISECFGNTGSKTYDISTAWGALYHSTGSSVTNSVQYPKGLFIDTPTVQATACRGNYAVFIAPKNAGTASVSPEYYVVNPTVVSCTVSIDLYCVGRWK